MSTMIPLAQIGFLQHRRGDIIKGRYEVLSHLGGGNFGSVYRVRDGVVGNFLACKEMHVLNDPATGKDERSLALELFKREALNLATLRHPHIPAAYFEQEDGLWNVCPRCGLDFSEQESCPDYGAQLLKIEQRHYLMMDFIDGATLEELAVEYSKQRGRPLPEADCIEWIAQIASALRALHRLGVVHRDIKPDNVTIRAEDNMAMLLDFGLTKKVEESGTYGTLRLSGTGRFGTPGYAPPDAQEQQNPEARSDIYALGMTLKRLLTGRDPQDENDLRELMQRAPRFFNTRLSSEAERILQTATATKKADRYENVEAMLSDLNELRKHESSTRNLPPFTFADGFRARNLNDLVRAVETHPKESLNYLWNGMFADWLRQNGFAAPATVAEKVVVRFSTHPQRAMELFRRSLYTTRTPDILPKLQIEPSSIALGGVPSGGQKSVTVRVRNVGAGFQWGKILIEETAQDGVDPLLNIGNELPGLTFPLEWEGNEASIEIALDASQIPLGGQSGTLLFESENETVRVPISYTVEPLPLHVIPQAVNFGTVILGTRVAQRLVVRCLQPGGVRGGGMPRGAIHAAELPDAEVPERFHGEEPFEVTVYADRPNTIARSYAGALFLDTNGGRLRVPVTYRIALPPRRWLALTLGMAFQYSIVFLLARLGYAMIDPNRAVQWLWTPQAGAYPYAIRGLAPLFVGATLGLAIGWRFQDDARVDPMYRALLPFLCLFAGLGFGWILAWAGHWGFWLPGDWLLFPLRRFLGEAQNSAPIAWSCAGAVGGLLWGLSRALSAIGNKSARSVVLFALGFLCFALLINAMLSTP